MIALSGNQIPVTRDRAAIGPLDGASSTSGLLLPSFVWKRKLSKFVRTWKRGLVLMNYALFKKWVLTLCKGEIVNGAGAENDPRVLGNCTCRG